MSLTLTLQQREEKMTMLKDAEAAYHRVITGTAARVFVDQNGERIEYVSANASRLMAYILSLKQELGLLRITGPMRPWF